MLERIANLTWSRPKLVLALVTAFAAFAGVVGHDVEEHLKAAGFTDSASESERATGLLRDSLGYDANPGIVVVLRDPAGRRLDLRATRVRREVARIHSALARTKHVGRVFSPLRGGGGLLAGDGRSVVLSAHLSVQDVEDAGGEAAEDAEARIGASSLDVSIGGFAASFNDVNDQTREDLTNAELIAFPTLTVLLLLVFRGVIAAAIPLLIGVFSILGTFLVLRVMSSLVDTSLFALNIATALSLGLAVDYALLMVSRYREEIDRSGATRDAHRRTVLTAGRAALFSGLTVAAAMASLVVLPQRFLYSLGVAGAAVGILSAVIAVLVVPSLLRLAGTRINSLSIRRGPAVSDESGGWYRLARWVMRRPATVAIASMALLLAFAAPMFGVVLTGPSAQAVPPGKSSFEANEYVEAHYPRDVTEAVIVSVHGTAGRGALARLERQIRRLDGVTRAGSFVGADRRTAFASVALAGPALSGASQDVVDQIRSLRPPGDAAVFVSGNTARFIDQKRSLADHAPLVALLVCLTTFVLLFMLTGSVLLPLKTLLMNVLTLCATVGLLVLAFQEGWLEAPLDYMGPGAIEVTSLVFLFAVLFGLATDYAVLVMARVKEEHDNGASNEEAVAHGIARTGRVITAAAVLIAVVFLAFAVSPVFFMKQIAIGIAVGVILDATIVRGLLVPSLMRLLGKWNWWAPAPLRRLHRRYGLDEA
ncbi:MAG: MMPL family transporter [Thermoleophilaceae bacterium]|nr:MMPL family transporter [Thermoleophilaceae bacterium]